MQIPVLIEPVAGNGYRARGVEPFGLSAEGATREEVLAKLREQLQARLRAGAEVLSLDVTEQAAANPWVEFAGMFKDDPYFEEWQQAIAENRRKIEEDPEIP
jgi:predicted RNase H-like HicB family nuclease